MLSNISDLFTMASLVICMLLSGIIFYYLRTRINMLEQSVMDQAQLLQQVVTSIKSSQFRQMGLQQQWSQQQQQQQQQQEEQQDQEQNMEKCPASNSIKLIEVSDDSEFSDDDDSDDDSDDDDNDSDNDNDNDNKLYYTSGNSNNSNSNGGSKIIDLSAITSSSSMSFLPLTKSDDVKIIELKSNINLNDDSDDESDDQSDSDQSDDQSDNESDNQSDDQSDNQSDQSKDDNADDQNDNADANNQSNIHIGNSNRNLKSIVIEEDVTLEEDSNNILSLDKMKNMPVNTLRNLAKKKLNNVDTPTINKMSKKEILKAFNS
jgi:hypothetical protein